MHGQLESLENRDAFGLEFVETALQFASKRMSWVGGERLQLSGFSDPPSSDHPHVLLAIEEKRRSLCPLARLDP